MRETGDTSWLVGHRGISPSQQWQVQDTGPPEKKFRICFQTIFGIFLENVGKREIIFMLIDATCQSIASTSRCTHIETKGMRARGFINCNLQWKQEKRKKEKDTKGLRFIIQKFRTLISIRFQNIVTAGPRPAVCCFWKCFSVTAGQPTFMAKSESLETAH